MSSRATTRSKVRDGERLVPAQDRFASRARSSRRRGLRRLLWLVVGCTLVGSTAWLVLASPVLAVHDIEVTGVPPADVAGVRKAAAVPVGEPLATLDVGAVARRIASAPVVAHVSVHRSYPQTLTIDVTLRKPVLAVRTPQGDLDLVDVEGVAFRTVDTAPRDLPVVRAGSSGAVSKDGVDAALSMLAVVPADLSGRVEDLRVSDADILSFSIGRTSVVWGTGDRPQLKEEILRALLRRHPRLIDVSAPDTPVTR